MQQAKVDTFSGTVIQDSDLGLPSIPGIGGSDDARLTSLTSGTHTLGVWKSGPDKARLQVQGSNDESDVVLNGKNLWTWSYKDNKATHRTLTGSVADQKSRQTPKLPADAPKTPEDAAKQALAALDGTTDVRTDGTAEVAGLDAYELVLTPKADQKSLIDEVRIAVDGTNFMPLRFEVIAGKTPTTVFQVAYRDISFDTPSDNQFTFNPPKNAKVTEVAPKTAPTQPRKAPNAKQLEARKAEAAKDTKVVGTGWGTVVVRKLDAKDQQAMTGQLAQVTRSLPQVKGSWGSGRLFSATAFSAVLTDDGRIAVGAVPADQLYAALAK
jgi:outer membrane lipoprotein-sorting protein